MTNNLKLLLREIAPFDPRELDKIVPHFKPRSVKKGSILLHQGDTCKEFYFVAAGSIRTFFIDRKGSEKTRFIILDNQIGTTLTSFISRQPSSELIEALEDTDLLVLHHHDFYQLNNEIDNWKIFYQHILERAYTYQNRRIEALVTLTAKQRYEDLLTRNPLLIQRLSNKIVASYLDMREETLSRLKSN